LLQKLIASGARLHQAGCNGCIGMGQAPATGRISLRTVPRNFPGRSGTKEDQVYLCSPETAAASALTGVITDPRTLNMAYPRFVEPDRVRINTRMLLPPADAGITVELEKGPNIKPLPVFEGLSDDISGPVLLKVGDDISTDDIMPAGSRVLPYRSNIPEISRFVFSRIDERFYERALAHQRRTFFVVGGNNYGQGSSREHAALAPRYLGLRVVIAKSFARIHRQNLVNFGILPLMFVNSDDYDRIRQEDVLGIERAVEALRHDRTVTVRNTTQDAFFAAEHGLSARQLDAVLAGGLINVARTRRTVH
jgi:aconitate hydratase